MRHFIFCEIYAKLYRRNIKLIVKLFYQGQVKRLCKIEGLQL
jgi:hypothetical protein